MRAAAAVVAAGFLLAATASAAEVAPWSAATASRMALSDAQTALVLGDSAGATERIETAQADVGDVLGTDPAALRTALRALDAAGTGDERALAAASGAVWTTILATAYSEAARAARRGDVATARSWLLVRETRPPTRFSRAADDATVALDGLAGGSVSPRAAAAAVRRDLLDTYDARLRTSLAELRQADELGYDTSRAELGALALGYWSILSGAHRATHGAPATRRLTSSFEQVAAAAASGGLPRAALARIDRALAGFRAAPLSGAELARRAGQLERFLQLVPIEYGRGVQDGRVTLEFEIQEAVTFRDGAAAAFHDVEPTLMAANAAATRRLGSALDTLGTTLAAASRSGAVASAEDVRETTDEALGFIDQLYPSSGRRHRRPQTSTSSPRRSTGCRQL